MSETARQLALAMTYEDTVRVADLKIRATRFARVRAEAAVEGGQILEIVGLPSAGAGNRGHASGPLGRWLLRTGWARGTLERLTRKGKIVKTTSVGGFLLLYMLMLPSIFSVARLSPSASALSKPTTALR